MGWWGGGFRSLGPSDVLDRRWGPGGDRTRAVHTLWNWCRVPLPGLVSSLVYGPRQSHGWGIGRYAGSLCHIAHYFIYRKKGRSRWALPSSSSLRFHRSGVPEMRRGQKGDRPCHRWRRGGRREQRWVSRAARAPRAPITALSVVNEKISWPWATATGRQSADGHGDLPAASRASRANTRVAARVSDTTCHRSRVIHCTHSLPHSNSPGSLPARAFSARRCAEDSPATLDARNALPLATDQTWTVGPRSPSPCCTTRLRSHVTRALCPVPSGLVGGSQGPSVGCLRSCLVMEDLAGSTGAAARASMFHLNYCTCRNRARTQSTFFGSDVASFVFRCHAEQRSFWYASPHKSTSRGCSRQEQSSSNQAERVNTLAPANHGANLMLGCSVGVGGKGGGRGRGRGRGWAGWLLPLRQPCQKSSLRAGHANRSRRRGRPPPGRLSLADFRP